MAGMPNPAIAAEPDLAPPSVLRIVEALLFVGGDPLSPERAAQAVRGLTPAQFVQAMDMLNDSYRDQGRPYRVQAQGTGYVMTLRPRFRPVIDKLYGGPREARLSPATIDVLALVAYRQPVAKAEIDAMRGHESGALLRQLVRRGLVVVQRGDAAQKEVTFGTSPRFLEVMGLGSLDELPQTQDLQRL
jgi:segregation and condensation protein B